MDWTFNSAHEGNELRILLASRGYRVGPELAMLETGRSHCQTFVSSLDTESFTLATCGVKAAIGRPTDGWDSKLEMYCRYQGVGRWEDTARDYELWGQHLNGFLDFCHP